jgi:transcriptional regulator with XRE-family HTH domain
MTTLSEQLTSTDGGEKIWHQERSIFETTERICELMEQNQVTRSELAQRLGKSRGYITQLLDGTANMTIRTLSDVYLALGRAYHSTDGPISISNVPPMGYRIFDGEVNWTCARGDDGSEQDAIPDTETSKPTAQSA